MGKRSLDPGSNHTSKATKYPKLGDEVLTEAPRGVNLIEDGAKTCTHEVAWPDGKHDERSRRVPSRKAGPPAKEYAFKLDPFQQTAINCLEAGKTAP